MTESTPTAHAQRRTDLRHGQIVADADALLHATTDQASEKIAGLRTRLQTDLNAAPGRFAEFAAMDVDKTRQDIRDALPKSSDAAQHAAGAAKKAAQNAEESVKKAAESCKEAAQYAAPAARELI